MTVKILLVEDDESDVLFVKRYIKSNNLDVELVVAIDGGEALDIIRGQPGNGPLTKPFIVVTDLNMPRMSGHEFIRELRADAALKSTVVFVLTSSLLKSDIELAHQLNVAGYFVKDDEVISDCLELLASYCRIAAFETPA